MPTVTRRTKVLIPLKLSTEADTPKLAKFPAGSLLVSQANFKLCYWLKYQGVFLRIFYSKIILVAKKVQIKALKYKDCSLPNKEAPASQGLGGRSWFKKPKANVLRVENIT